LYQELIEGDAYEIKSISVFNHFKLIAGILTNRSAILHYHWLEFQDLRSLTGMPWKIACIWLFSKLGGKIVWTLHNEFPHDQRFLPLHRYLHKKMAKWSDVLHVHCHKAVDLMSEKLSAPKKKFRLIPHPEFPADPIDRSEARNHLNTTFNSELSSEIPVLLMFGNISRYKQIEHTADLVMSLESECRLLIVGPVKKGNMSLFDELKKKQKKSSRIQLIAQFIDEDRVPWFYSAADICVFSYREILSSGGYHMAKAYQKKVIAPDMGCLSEEGNEPNVELFSTSAELESLLNQEITKITDGRA
jgi:glycosyltransferase involved in cell wall biosynthesis